MGTCTKICIAEARQKTVRQSLRSCAILGMVKLDLSTRGLWFNRERGGNRYRSRNDASD